MVIKRRDMYLTNFYDDNKNYYSKEITYGNSKGVASIIKFNNIEKPHEIHYNFKDETIVDNNYTWIQIAFIDANFWIKAMYDEKDRLVEIYIDVTRKNYFDNKKNPEYDDLFLDIIVPRKGHIYQMDDVELMKALREGIITETEYKTAKVVCHNIISYLDVHHKEFLDFIKKLKLELEYELESDK